MAEEAPHTQDENPFLSTPSYVDKASKEVGKQDYNGLCQGFVDTMTGNPNRYKSAVEAWNGQLDKAHGGLEGIRSGDLLYFNPDASNRDDGHTGIYIGNGQFVSATDYGVKTENVSDWMKKTGQKVLGYIRK